MEKECKDGNEKKCRNGFFSAFTNEDRLDRVPGMKSWKIVTTILVLIAVGCFIIPGLIDGTFFAQGGGERNYLKTTISIHNKEKETNKDVGTIWNWVHFFGYFLITLLFPDSWLLIWLLGLAWESFEALLKWEDWNDILFNTAGIASAVVVRKLLIPGVDRWLSPTVRCPPKDTEMDAAVGKMKENAAKMNEKAEAMQQKITAQKSSKKVA